MITEKIKNIIAKEYEYCMTLAYAFGRPYEKIMRDEEYQKNNFIRPAVIKKLKEMKDEIESLSK